MKCLKIRIECSPYPPFKLQIRPGTKCSDVLSYLQLTEDYVLSPLSDPTKTFTPEEGLYDLIENDQKLLVRLSPEAADRYAHLFLP